MSASPKSTHHLDPGMLEYLRQAGTEVEMDAGETIIRKGDPGTAVYFVLAGEVEVHLQSADGRHLELCNLGVGEYFGELSILRSRPVSANVTATTSVRLLRYSAELFPTALTECEPLRDLLLSRLAQDLQRSTTDAWDLFKREQAFAELARFEGLEDSMLASSPRMRAIKKRLVEIGGKQVSALITGASGTGRTLAARLIHRSSGSAERPLLVVDCADLTAEGAHAALYGFDIEGDSLGDAASFGALHLAHRGDLILRNLGALPAREQEELARHLKRMQCGKVDSFPKVRIVATAHDLEDPTFSSEVVESLRSEFCEVVRLPSLAERPRDIVPLARHFLDNLEGANEYELTQGAQRALVSLRCPVHNVDELRDIVEMAARCCTDGRIRAEHIFVGLGDEEPTGLALGRPPLIMRFLDGGGLTLVRGVTLVSFLAVIVLCITAGTTAAGRLANSFIWSVWEPVVFALFLLAGALWCTICPLSTAGRAAKKALNLRHNPPPWLNGKLAVTVPVFGLLAILWAERVFHMTEAPLGSGILLLVLILFSVALCVLFKREVWCRHVCPLGRLAEVWAPAAPLSLATDRTLCASTCTTHDCFQGSDKIPGCTVFHHPMNLGEAHHCKLCADCLRSCPHDSTDLYVRLPAQGIAQLEGTGRYPSVFAVTLLPLALLFLVAGTWDLFAQPLVLAVMGIVSIAIGYLVTSKLPRFLGRPGRGSAIAQRVAAGLAVLAWGPLMAAQFRNIPALQHLTLRSDDGASWFAKLNEGVSLLPLASAGIVLLAGATSAIILWQAKKRSRTARRSIGLPVWSGVTAVWAGSLVLSLALVL